jgi:hypothetical protein
LCFSWSAKTKSRKTIRHSRVSRSNRSRSAWRKRVPVEVNVYRISWLGDGMWFIRRICRWCSIWGREKSMRIQIARRTSGRTFSAALKRRLPHSYRPKIDRHRNRLHSLIPASPGKGFECDGDLSTTTQRKTWKNAPSVVSGPACVRDYSPFFQKPFRYIAAITIALTPDS